MTDVNRSCLPKYTLGRNHVGGLVTVTNGVESPDEQLQQSHNDGDGTRRVEHGTGQDIVMLDLGGSDCGRQNSGNCFE